MKKSSGFALLSLVLLAAYVRLEPLTRVLYWGADFGEYFLVSQILARSAPLPDPYQGWGVAYPEFPGMGVLNAAVSWAGVPFAAGFVLVVPLLSALVVVPAYLIGRQLTGRDAPALVAAAVVAVALPHVYPTSHPVPGALGDLLLAGSLLLLLRVREDRRMALLLVLLASALAVVHHLSSYFLIVVTFTVAFLRIVLRGRPFAAIRRETAFLGFLVAVNVAYWVGYTDNFRTFLGFGRVPWWATALLILALPATLYPIARIRETLRGRYTPSFPSRARGVRVLALAAGSTALVFVALYLFSVPGTTIRPTTASLLYGAPFLSLFFLAAPGRKLLDFLPGGDAVTGWFLALNLSWIVGAWVAPTFLIPYRHMEYLVLPLALFAGAGAWRFLGAGRRARRVVVPLLVGLIALAAVTAVPPREALGNHFEGTRAQGMNVVHWASGTVDGVTATDHRASSTLFGLGSVRATWDTAVRALHAPSFAQARDEMLRVEDLPGGPARVDYVLVDRDLLAGATLQPWDPASPLDSAAQDKFEEAPYVKLYDDGYSQLYWVNWGLV